MEVVLGPILRLNKADAGQWHVSGLVVTDEDTVPPVYLGTAAAPAPVRLLAQPGFGVAWRFDLALVREEQDRWVHYTAAGKSASFLVPGTNAPLRMLYASCNGSGSKRIIKSIRRPNALWEQINEQHGQRPYHLLLLGGDQVYADMMWDTVKELSDWAEARDRTKRTFNQKMADQVARFYFKLYCDRWGQADPARVFAGVPTLMMWDDHDIFDGWGSYDDELQQCPVYQGILACAQDAFRVFQLHEYPNNTPGGLNQHAFCVPGRQNGNPAELNLSLGLRIGDLAILALDTRSERSDQSIMTQPSWDAVFAWVDSLADCRHLLVMASIPVVYPSYAFVEKLLRLTPGRQDIEDDLRDHWRSQPHREQRLRMIHRLLKFAAEKECRVTVLSGDVHVAALGVLESTRYPSASPNTQVINQLISSPIVNLPQPGISRFLLERLARKVERVDRDITARMLEFPGTRDRFLADRNWLSLSFDKDQRIWAEWFAEGHAHPYTKVIHPPVRQSPGSQPGDP